MIVDAHQHVWDPCRRRHAWLDDYPTLRRRYWTEDFAAPSAAAGVTASVLVQVLADAAETEEFLALAAGGGIVAGDSAASGEDVASRNGAGAGGAGLSGIVAGVVGWSDLTGPDVTGEISRLRGLPGGDRLVGIRHLVQDETDSDWLDRADVRRGLGAVGESGLAYDLLVRPAQLPAALRVVAELAGVRFVLDHGAKPDIAGGSWEPWAGFIAELAARPNLVCKFSGLVTEAGAGWDRARIAPYAGWLLDQFGPARLLFGSDWPVCTLAADYSEVLDLARDLLASRLSPTELNAVFGANAIREYRLGGL